MVIMTAEERSVLLKLVCDRQCPVMVVFEVLQKINLVVQIADLFAERILS